VVPQQIAQFGRDPYVPGKEELEREAGHVGAARRCHLTKDCLRAISVGEDGYLNVWRLQSGHQDRINEVAVSNDGGKVLTCSQDRSVRVWDAFSGTQLLVLGTHTQPVTSFVLSAPVLECLASGPLDEEEEDLDQALHVDDRGEQGPGRGMSTVRSILKSSLSRPGSRRRVLTADGDGDREQGPKGGEGGRRTASPAMSTLSEMVIATASRDCSSHILDCNKGTTLFKLGGIPRGGWPQRKGGGNGLSEEREDETSSSHRERVDVAVFSPCSLFVATGSHDKSVRVWSSSTGACTAVMRGHTGNVTSLVFTKYSDTLLSASSDHSCCVWEVRTGNMLASLSGHFKAVTCVSYSPVSDRAATASNDKTVRLWNLRTAAQNVALRGHTGAVNAVAIAPSGRQIFSGGRDKILNVWGVDDTTGAWDVSEGYARMQVMRKLAKKPVIPGSAVTCLCMAANGGYVAVGYADGWLELMRSENLSIDQKRLAHPHAAHGEGGGVVSVAFSRDSLWLASCGGDRVVLLFRAHYVSDSPRSRQLYGKNAGLSLVRARALSRSLCLSGSLPNPPCSPPPSCFSFTFSCSLALALSHPPPLSLSAPFPPPPLPQVHVRNIVLRDDANENSTHNIYNYSKYMYDL
jgi:WD40 repeat protein